MIDIVISLITQFLEGKFTSLNGQYRENPHIVHYYKEIIRYWSKLNFIVNKTLRSMGKTAKIGHDESAIYLYSTYRLMMENATIDSIVNELKLSKESNILSYLTKMSTFSWKRAFEEKSKEEILSIEEAMPSFFIEHLLPVMSLDFLKKNIQFLNDVKKSEVFTVRINDL